MRKFILPALLLVAGAQAIAIEPPANLPGKFQAVLHASNGGLPQGALYGEFTMQGPVQATLVPLPRNVGEVVSDGQGNLFGMGGHELYQLDAVSYETTEIVAKGVPEVSWTMGLAYDTKRNRVLLATLGGEGFIYSYDHANESWSVLGSLDNVDVTAIAYLEPSDRIFAIAADRSPGREGQALLYEYAAESGELVQHRSIELLIVGEFIDRALQLISVDNTLVFVQMPKAAKDSGALVIHMIDPKSGEVKQVEKP